MFVILKKNLTGYSVLKHGTHDQRTHNPHGAGGRALLENLPKQLNSVSQDIDTVFSKTDNVAAANDLAQAKVSLFSAPKVADPKRAAQFIQSARISVESAARKLSSTKGNLAIILTDASDRLGMLSQGLLGPEGGGSK